MRARRTLSPATQGLTACGGLLAICALAACPEATSVGVQGPGKDPPAPRPSTSAPLEDASARVATPAPVASPASFGGAIPEGCYGDTFDLARLRMCHCHLDYEPELIDGRSMVRAGARCEDRFSNQDLTARVRSTLAVEPSTLESSGSAKLTATLENLTDAPLSLLFARPFDLTVEPVPFDLSILDAKGKDVTRVGPCGSGIGGVHPADIAVGLGAKGRAVLSIDWVAERTRTRYVGDRCDVKTEPLPPGKYTLELRIPISPKVQWPGDTSPLRVPIVVTKRKP